MRRQAQTLQWVWPGRIINCLSRLRLNYVGSPETMHLPHGPDRLRKAYEVYLAEEENPVPYDEARRHLREWIEARPDRRGR